MHRGDVGVVGPGAATFASDDGGSAALVSVLSAAATTVAAVGFGGAARGRRWGWSVAALGGLALAVTPPPEVMKSFDTNRRADLARLLVALRSYSGSNRT